MRNNMFDPEVCVIICLILWIFKRGIDGKEVFSENLSVRQKFFKFYRKFTPKRSCINQPILFFVLVCVLSVIGSTTVVQSTHNFFTKTLEWFIVFFLVLEVFDSRKSVYVLLTIVAFTACSTALDSIVQFHITYKDIFLGHVIEPGGRATAGFKTSNGLGAYLVLTIPMILTLVFMRSKGFLYRMLVSAVCITMLWSLVVTYSRGAWVGMIIGLLFMFLVFLRHKIKSGLSVSLWFLVTIIIFSAISVSFVNNNFSLKFLERGDTHLWRLLVWQDSIQMIKDKPIFGHGINTFMNNFELYRRDIGTNPTYAHNCYIQLASETGIMGLGIFLWLIITFYRECLRKIKIFFTQDYNFALLLLGILSGISAFLVHSFFDTNFYSLQLSIYMWFMIGILVALINLDESNIYA